MRSDFFMKDIDVGLNMFGMFYQVSFVVSVAKTMLDDLLYFKRCALFWGRRMSSSEDGLPLQASPAG